MPAPLRGMRRRPRGTHRVPLPERARGCRARGPPRPPSRALDVGRELACGSGVQFVETVPGSTGELAQPSKRRLQLVAASGPQPNRSASAASDRIGETPWSAACSGGPETKRRRPDPAAWTCGGASTRRAAPAARPAARSAGTSSSPATTSTNGGPAAACPAPGCRAEQRRQTAEALRAEKFGPLRRAGRARASACTTAPRRDRTLPRGRPHSGPELRGDVACERGDVLHRLGWTGRGCARPAIRRAAAPPSLRVAAASPSLCSPTTHARNAKPARSHASRKRSSARVATCLRGTSAP